MAGPEQNRSLVTQMASEIAPETSSLLDFLLRNGKIILAALGIFIVAAAAYGVYTWHSGKQLAAAQEELGNILVMPSDTERLARLKTFAATAPSGMMGGLQLAIARTALLAKDYPSATAAWDALAGDPKAPIYATAVIGKAESLVMEGKDAEALGVLTGASIPADSPSANIFNSILADLAEKLGDYPKAIAASEKLITGSAATGPEEADFWRQKAASLRLEQAEAQAAQSRQKPLEREPAPTGVEAPKKP